MSDLFLLQNNAVLDLFEIKLNDFEGYFRFHGSKNLSRDLVFSGKTYLYIPSEISNLEYSSDGKQNRPTLSIANVNNYINNLLKDRNDFLGKRFYRKKILARDLDAVNFGEANKNPLGVAAFVDFISIDTYVIHKKNTSSKEKVEFELANTMDIDGQTAPARKVYNDSCQWQYRGCGCNYGKISGWNGTKILLRKTKYSTLADAISGASIGSTLSLHLMSDTTPTTTTFSGTVNYVDKIYPVLTAWTDSSASPITINLTGSPKKYVNAGRMNNKTGLLFAISKNDVPDTLTISHNYNTDITVFYVSEMIRKGKSINTRMGLGIANKTWFVGYGDATKPSQDGCAAGNGFLSKLDGVNPAWDQPNIYALKAPTSSSVTSDFYKNGARVASSTGFTNSPNNIGLNLAASLAGGWSDIVVYEIIIFTGLLDQAQVEAVNSYLGTKYALNTYGLIQYETRLSKDFFGTTEGDLGVPIADENNKVFMGEGDISFSNGQSYGLNTMVWKGDYNPTTTYAKGDFVKIDNTIEYDFNETSISKNNEPPSRFFVLVSESSVGKNPYFYTKDWVEDKCSKNLNGCSLRFGDLTDSFALPFGAFPGTVSYDYKLPG